MRTATQHIRGLGLKASTSGMVLLVLVMFLLLAAGLRAESSLAAGDAPSAITLDHKAKQNLQLRSLWQYIYVPAATAISPDAVWSLPASDFKSDDTQVKMDFSAANAYIARFQVQQAASDFSSYITVPSAHLDKVQLWYRTSGTEQWRAFQAGDRIVQDEWPFVGPYPAFELPSQSAKIDVVMRFENAGNLNLRVYAQSNKSFHSERNFYSNGTGAVLGLIASIILICFITLRLRRPDFLFLALAGLASFFFYIARSGVGFITVWPNAPSFNDISSNFFLIWTAVFLLMAVSYLAPIFKGGNLLRLVYGAVALLGSLLAIACWLWLPAPQSNVLTLVYIGLVFLMCFGLSAFMALARGDRVLTWVSMSLLAVVVAFAAQVYSHYVLTPTDVWGVVSGVAWTAAALGLFSASYGKYQYGHTALGDQISYNEELDGLTGLLNAKGFEQSMSLTVLAAGQKRNLAPVITLIMCRLPPVERQDFDTYGKTVSNQAEVRLASAIKHSLSETAVVARVQRGCMVAFVTERVTAKVVESSATKIISSVLNAEDLPNFVSDLGLQILIGQVPSHRLSTGTFQALHAYGEAHEYENKTIHWVELSSVTKPGR